MAAGLEVITGPMFSGKTEELIRRLKRWEYARVPTVVLKPAIDHRTDEEVRSRAGSSLKAVEVPTASPIETIMRHAEGVGVVGFDEVQFFEPGIGVALRLLLKQGKLVIASGLDLDFRGMPFPATAEFLSLATKVNKQFAVCTACRKERAHRTQRMVASTQTVLVGDGESYEPRCLGCFDPPP